MTCLYTVKYPSKPTQITSIYTYIHERHKNTYTHPSLRDKENAGSSMSCVKKECRSPEAGKSDQQAGPTGLPIPRDNFTACNILAALWLWG